MRPSLDFFSRFLKEHLARHPHAGLPIPGTREADTFYSTWRKLLAEVDGISREALTEASERLVAQPAIERKHFATLLAFTKEAILARRPEGKLHDVSTREGAELASKSCECCDGAGFVPVFRRAPVTDRAPESVAAHCVCPLGRWLRRALEGDPTTLKRIPDLDALRTTRAAWTSEPPRRGDFTTEHTEGKTEQGEEERFHRRARRERGEKGRAGSRNTE